jgi:hypothetical protein
MAPIEQAGLTELFSPSPLCLSLWLMAGNQRKLFLTSDIHPSVHIVNHRRE